MFKSATNKQAARWYGIASGIPRRAANARFPTLSKEERAEWRAKAFKAIRGGRMTAKGERKND